MKIKDLEKIEGLSKILKDKLEPDYISIGEFTDEIIVKLTFTKSEA